MVFFEKSHERKATRIPVINTDEDADSKKIELLDSSAEHCLWENTTINQPEHTGGNMFFFSSNRWADLSWWREWMELNTGQVWKKNIRACKRLKSGAKVHLPAGQPFEKHSIKTPELQWHGINHHNIHVLESPSWSPDLNESVAWKSPSNQQEEEWEQCLYPDLKNSKIFHKKLKLQWKFVLFPLHNCALICIDLIRNISKTTLIFVVAIWKNARYT